MFLTLEKDSWGYFIYPSFLRGPIYPDREIPDGSVIVTKKKEYIPDIGRTIIKTEYFYVKEGKTIQCNKLGISDVFADLIADYTAIKKHLPYYTTIKKQTRNITTLAFKPDKWDEFNVKIKKGNINGQDPTEYFEEISFAPDPPVKKKRKSSSKTEQSQSKNTSSRDKTFQIKGSKGNEYTVTKKVTGSIIEWNCTCPHYMFRLSKSGGKCKHIRQVG